MSTVYDEGVLGATEDIFGLNVIKCFGGWLVERLVGFESELSKFIGSKSECLLFGWIYKKEYN